MRDYASYQSAKDAEYLKACREANIEPMLNHDSPANRAREEKETGEIIIPSGAKRNGKIIPAVAEFPLFEEEEEISKKEEERKDAATAVLKVLYLLTGSNHPQLRLVTDCLLAMINRTEEKSQAAIARKYGLTRAAVSKRMRDMRKGNFLGNLEIYFFGGREDLSEAARARAIDYHNNKKGNKNKCTTKSQQLASKTLEQL